MSEQRRILVTGAGGFIGGRVVEILHAMGRDEVVAGVRRWSSAARIGRLPIEIVACDVADSASVHAALAGVTHVVHCAVGDARATVTGTEVLLAAARAAGVRRLVHVSTIDVYGRESGVVTEEAPMQETGAAYGDTKIAAEQAVRRALQMGLEATIVRPTIVYGPYSPNWTIEYAERLQKRPWPFPRAQSSGICNAVYVDDVVQGILRCLSHPAAVGEAFNLNGADWPSWYDYFEQLNAALGLPPIVAESRSASTLHAYTVQPVRQVAKLALRHFQPQIMGLYQRSALAKRLMKRVEGVIRAAPTTAEFRLYSRTATFPTTKAERLIGYRPSVGLAEGLQLSAAWLRHHGYVRGEAPGAP